MCLKDSYCVIKPLAQGGMGRTFLAVNRDKFDELCVIKQMSSLPEVQNNPRLLQEYRRLFNEEAKQLHKLGKHSQIPEQSPILSKTNICIWCKS